MEKWIEMFGPPLLSEKKGYKLYKALKEYAEKKRWWGYYEKHFRYWYNKFPQIFEQLPLAVDSVISEIKLDFTTAGLGKQRKVILDVSSKVKKELEKQIKRIW